MHELLHVNRRWFTAFIACVPDGFFLVAGVSLPSPALRFSKGGKLTWRGCHVCVKLAPQVQEFEDAVSIPSPPLPPSLLPSLLLDNSYTYGITFFMGVRALLYPPFLLKTKIQVARGATEQSAIQVARATIREEGIRGLYKVRVEGTKFA